MRSENSGAPLQARAQSESPEAIPARAERVKKIANGDFFARDAAMRPAKARFSLLLFWFEAAGFGIHRHIIAALLRNDFAGDPVVAIRGAFGHNIEALVPFAE